MFYITRNDRVIGMAPTRNAALALVDELCREKLVQERTYVDVRCTLQPEQSAFLLQLEQDAVTGVRHCPKCGSGNTSTKKHVDEIDCRRCDKSFDADCGREVT